ncbi:RIP metalloprotease RasP [Thermacetogenium phaeum DSM 12270]|uniref:Zinc metalloprotease n=1 Tax=Thermacetogenium phaeum (strain ATCC BAA-254 / DSM 26808 / PB) TaxID=1089553 RepID=K4LE89_THEPS|nr:RIP metalloprotease RseP [Thermacetogenium phaeum]AFV11346.1 RIP metalloprotease RasP [Thermacetogenium phaeum DSM 12270]MDN5365609.1 regulator of sigma protease [Thermacetogenium sp.]
MFIIIAVLIFAFLIVVHELGHFLVAKMVGIQVDEFSIGFGPKLLGYRGRGDTVYSLRLLPLGGYVRMAGMDPKEDDRINGFNKKPLRDRFAVISAGSVMNFVTAIFLFFLTFSLIGVPAPSNSNTIGDVVPGSPAAQAGLRAGDRIVMVDGLPTQNWEDVAGGIRRGGQREISLTVERNGESFAVLVTPRYDPQLNMVQIGIKQHIIWEKQGFLRAVQLGLEQAIGFTRLIINSLIGLVTKAVPADEIAGPVGITKAIGDAAREGPGYLLTFTAVLGINLALINLLPIPALDGSKLMFLLIEGLRGKPVDPEKENFVHLIGFAILMVLFLIITYNDIMRILTGG